MLFQNMFEIAVDVFGKYLSDCMRIMSKLYTSSLALNVKVRKTTNTRNTSSI